MKIGSVWHDLTDLTALCPEAKLPREAQVVIVGGGISGISAFWHLAKRGVHVVLLERGPLAYGATGRNAGFLLAGTVEYFDDAVQRWGKSEAAAIWAFTFENNTSLKAAIRRESIDCELEERGQVILASDEVEWQRLQHCVRLLQECGWESQLLDTHGVAARTGLQGFLGGREQVDDAILQPAKLVRGFGEAGVREGGVILNGVTVMGMHQTDTGWSIATDLGDLWAGHLILTSNAWLREFWPAFTDTITPVRAQALATAPVPLGLIDGALSTNYGYEYWRQLPNGQVLLGGKRWTEPDLAVNTTLAEPQDPTYEQLVAFLHETYPQLTGVPISHSWAGLMAFSKDHLPLIGAIPGVEQAYVAGGYTGHGMAFGFLAGRSLSELILDRESSLDLGRFDPARFHAPAV